MTSQTLKALHLHLVIEAAADRHCIACCNFYERSPTGPPAVNLHAHTRHAVSQAERTDEARRAASVTLNPVQQTLRLVTHPYSTPTLFCSPCMHMLWESQHCSQPYVHFKPQTQTLNRVT